MNMYIGAESFGKYSSNGYDLINEENICLCEREDAECIIAGTESYTAEILGEFKNLKVLARMGVGYDNIDLQYCRNNNITVVYTPDAPSGSVAELTIAQIFNMIRLIPRMNNGIRNKNWPKLIGRKLSELNIGVIGVGRIGKGVVERLQPFRPKNILCYDINEEMLKNFWVDSDYKFKICLTLKEILQSSDVITVHIPGNKDNFHFISGQFFAHINDGSYLINTSRGSILNEKLLETVLIHSPAKLLGIALDVFENEPYEGPLTNFNNILFTTHAGSMTHEARILMETQAVMECVTVMNGNEPINLVPMLESTV